MTAQRQQVASAITGGVGWPHESVHSSACAFKFRGLTPVIRQVVPQIVDSVFDACLIRRQSSVLVPPSSILPGLMGIRLCQGGYAVWRKFKFQEFDGSTNSGSKNDVFCSASSNKFLFRSPFVFLP